MSTVTDNLITQFQKKNEAAFEAIYNLYFKSIYGVVFNIVREDGSAHEITQDVFVKAWQKSETYSPVKGRIFTWLLNIARNAAIDKIRSKEFRKNKQNLNVDFFVDIVEGHHNLDRTTDSIGIKTFVSRLTESCKRLIEFLYFRGYTQKETAETLEMPIGTVKTRNRKCMNSLRDLLDIDEG